MPTLPDESMVIAVVNEIVSSAEPLAAYWK